MTDGFNLEAKKRALMKIPEVFWKIIFYGDKNREAIVFIVFNSPCPWDTPLLNKLRNPDSKCTRKNCIDFMKKYKMRERWSIEKEKKVYDASGLVFCCETEADASYIFEYDAELNNDDNEIALLLEYIEGASEVGSSSQRNKKRKRPPGG